MVIELFSNADVPQSQAVTVYYCGKEQCKKGHAYGPAVRTQYLFHYVASGKGIFRTKTATYRISAGQGFLITPNQTTYYEADRENPWTYYWIGFDGAEVPRILADCGLTEKNPIYRDASEGELASVLNKIIETFHNDSGDKYTILSLFYSAIALICAKGRGRRKREEGYVEKALNYIHHNYTYRIRIDDIARYVGLDRTYLFKLFVQDTGLSPQTYLIQYRLDNAERLLRESKLSVTEIAYSCGFRDSSSFCRLFKNRFCITPLAYRKRGTSKKDV